MSLTIILTLKNRSNFTLRWMRYMNDHFCKFNIIIADGGDDIFIENHLKNKDNYPNLIYDYYRFPFDLDLNTYYQKLNSTINLVKTDYILQADNDDFYILDELPFLIDFLDNNEDYIGARGALVDLFFTGKNDSGKNTTCNKYLLKKIFSEPIDQDNPIERIDFLCQNMSKYDYYSNWYCVFRTKILQKTFNNILPLKLSDMIVTEIALHILIINKGKIKVFPQLFYIRQQGSSMHGDTLIVNNEFLERFFLENFISSLDMALSTDDSLNYFNQRQIILKSVAAWFQIFIVNLYLSKIKINFIKKVYKIIKLNFNLKQTVILKNLDKYLLNK
jgi:glycosyltransferase domain-containing protein